jgi:hypothetical protein
VYANVHRSQARDVARPAIADMGHSRPIDPEVRHRMEPLFGVDFSRTRVHPLTSPRVAGVPAGTPACTNGADIYFAPAHWAPNTVAGNRLIAHELTHVIQQSAGSAGSAAARTAESEREASAAARLVAGGSPFRVQHRAKAAVACSPPTEQPAAKIEPLEQRWTEFMEHLDHEWNIKTSVEDGMRACGDWRIYVHADELEQMLARNPSMRQRMNRYWKFYDPARSGQPRDLHFEQGTPEDPLVMGYAGGEYPETLRSSQFAAAQRAAFFRYTMDRIEGVASGGPFATAGRVFGAVTAWATGRDMLAGSEIGAAFGGLADAGSVVKVGQYARARNRGYTGGAFVPPVAPRDTGESGPSATSGSQAAALVESARTTTPETDPTPATIRQRPAVRRLVSPPQPTPSPAETDTDPGRAADPAGQRRQGPVSPVENRLRVVAGQKIIVGVLATITVADQPAIASLGETGFSQFRAARAAALGGTGRAAVLPEVSQPPGTAARQGSQPSSGLVVEGATGSRNLEVMAWNTRAPVKGANVSHAERQVIDWFRGRDPRWIAQVRTVNVTVFGRDICSLCDADMKSLRAAYPSIQFNWVRGDTGHPFR